MIGNTADDIFFLKLSFSKRIWFTSSALWIQAAIYVYIKQMICVTNPTISFVVTGKIKTSIFCLGNKGQPRYFFSA